MDRTQTTRWLESISAIVDHYRGNISLSEADLLEQITIANAYKGFHSDMSNFDAISLFKRIQEERNLYLKKFD